MKYSKEQRIDIGRQVYTHELSRLEASQKYEVSDSSLDVYVSLYKLASVIRLTKLTGMNQSRRRIHLTLGILKPTRP